MLNKSMWWFFLLLFGLLIGGIQSLGWWTGPAAAHAQVTQTSTAPAAKDAVRRHQQCQPTHWRSMVLHQ